MNTQKIAISVPRDIITIVDEISSKQGVSRSRYISSVLREKILDEKDRKIKDAYDRVFSDDAIKKEQLETCEWFEQSGSSEGQGW